MYSFKLKQQIMKTIITTIFLIASMAYGQNINITNAVVYESNYNGNVKSIHFEAFYISLKIDSTSIEYKSLTENFEIHEENTYRIISTTKTNKGVIYLASIGETLYSIEIPKRRFKSVFMINLGSDRVIRLAGER